MFYNILLTLIINQVVSESLASILLNSSNLLRIDLDGVNVLTPFLVTALEAVLPEKEVGFFLFYRIIPLNVKLYTTNNSYL